MGSTVGALVIIIVLLLVLRKRTPDLPLDLKDYINIRSSLPQTIVSSTGKRYVVYNYFTRHYSDYTQGLFVIPNASETKILQSTGEYSKSKIMYNTLDESSNVFST